MLLTVIVAKVSVFDDTQCGVRGKVGRVGTSYRAIWKVEGEEQKSDSLGGSAGAGGGCNGWDGSVSPDQL